MAQFHKLRHKDQFLKLTDDSVAISFDIPAELDIGIYF